MRRLIIAVDLEHYSQLPDSGQRQAQQAMSELLSEAGQHGALERAQWEIQPQGDGELALLPPGIDEAAVITSPCIRWPPDCTSTTGARTRTTGAWTRPRGSACGSRSTRA